VGACHAGGTSVEGSRAVAVVARHSWRITAARSLVMVVGYAPRVASGVRVKVTGSRGIARVARPSGRVAIEWKLATVVGRGSGATSGVRFTWTVLTIAAVGDAVVWVDGGLSGRSSASDEAAGTRRIWPI
jgi:hypothetical protein